MTAPTLNTRNNLIENNFYSHYFCNFNIEDYLEGKYLRLHGMFIGYSESKLKKDTLTNK